MLCLGKVVVVVVVVLVVLVIVIQAFVDRQLCFKRIACYKQLGHAAPAHWQGEEGLVGPAERDNEIKPEECAEFTKASRSIRRQ